MTNVVIVTNMWSKVGSYEGGMREQQLITDDRFFKPAMDRGARIFRHEHTVASALDILRHVLDNNPRPLAIQRELVNERRPFWDSAAGREVNHRLRAFTRKCSEDIISMRAELEAVVRMRDEKAEKELLDELQKLTSGLARARDDLAMLASDQYGEDIPVSGPDIEKPSQWDKVRGAYLVAGHKNSVFVFQDKNTASQDKIENVKEVADGGMSSVRIVIHHKSTSVSLSI
jgi:hypothetical protein